MLRILNVAHLEMRQVWDVSPPMWGSGRARH